MIKYAERRKILKGFMERVRSGALPTGLITDIPSAELTELASVHGFEWILINMEHTLLTTIPSIAPLARVAEAEGLPYIVKLPTWDPIMARDALNLGAYGLQVPDVRSKKDLDEIFDAVRFPPYGSRGMCVSARGTHYGAAAQVARESNTDFFGFQNEDVVIMPLIENREALDNLDEIIACEDVEIFTLGPFDLGLDLGMGEELLALDQDALQKLYEILATVAKKIRAAGKHVNVYLHGPSATLSMEEIVYMNMILEVTVPYLPVAALAGEAMRMGMQVRDATIEGYKGRLQDKATK